ncbi:hypothetical protein HK101_004058, partial [Irineochytrium annulatum]
METRKDVRAAFLKALNAVSALTEFIFPDKPKKKMEGKPLKPPKPKRPKEEDQEETNSLQLRLRTVEALLSGLISNGGSLPLDLSKQSDASATNNPAGNTGNNAANNTLMSLLNSQIPADTQLASTSGPSSLYPPAEDRTWMTPLFDSLTTTAPVLPPMSTAAPPAAQHHQQSDRFHNPSHQQQQVRRAPIPDRLSISTAPLHLPSFNPAHAEAQSSAYSANITSPFSASAALPFSASAANQLMDVPAAPSSRTAADKAANARGPTTATGLCSNLSSFPASAPASITFEASQQGLTDLLYPPAQHPISAPVQPNRHAPSAVTKPPTPSRASIQSGPSSGFRGVALSLQRRLRHRSADHSSTSSTSPTSPEDDHSATASPDAVLFYGRTSATTSPAWRSSPRYSPATGLMAIHLSLGDANAHHHDDDLPLPCAPDVACELIDMYFDGVHPYLPMLDRAPLEGLLSSGSDDVNDDAADRPALHLLLASLCALVTQQLPPTHPHHTLHAECFSRARLLAGRRFDWPSLRTVQALILLALVGQGDNINASAHQYVGMAARQAVEMGMHRGVKGQEAGTGTGREVTWWCLWVVDRYLGVMEGRPMAIRDKDFDTPFPAVTSAHLANLGAHAGLADILGRLADLVNRPAPPSAPRYPFLHPLQTESDSESENVDDDKLITRRTRKAIVNLQARLQCWRDSLPSHLARGIGGNEEKEGRWDVADHLAVMYDAVVVLVGRLETYATDDDGDLARSPPSQACVDSARKIVGALSSRLPPSPRSSSLTGSVEAGGSDAKFEFVMPGVVYAALAGVTIALEGALAGSVVEDDVRRGLASLDRLRGRSLFASYYRQLAVEVLAGRGVAIDGVAELEGAGRVEASRQHHGEGVDAMEELAAFLNEPRGDVGE